MNVEKEQSNKALVLTVVAALGVVFGDIGTSPLYALRECFSVSPMSQGQSIGIHESSVLGVLSLIFWSFISLVSVKYLYLLMNADNRGEGGNLALLALVHPRSHKGFENKFIVFMGLAGASLLFGDGIITPAISVLSAVEGLSVVSESFEPLVVPLTVLILVILFWFQRKGTESIGKVFGVVMLVWFVVLGILGAIHVFDYPGIWKAFSPWYAIKFLIDEQLAGFFVLSSVFLSVTGCEALYADMGHFGKWPIRYGWYCLAFPCLTLNYFGQGAFLLKHPEKVNDLFFSLPPSWALIPLVCLSTLATIIASQAVISGVFSLAKQAVQLGYFPRVAISHTSEDAMGQIYVGFVNRVLAIATIWLVLTFRSSSSLASAYGIAVSTTMITATSLLFFVMRDVWNWPTAKRWTVFLLLLTIDIGFFGSNVFKILSGGWFPIIVGGSAFFVMTTWFKGRQLVAARMSGGLLPLEHYIKGLRDSGVSRVTGTAVFLSSNVNGVPAAMSHYIAHSKSIHEQVILMGVKIEEVPYVEEYDRFQLEGLGEGFYRIIAHVGFMESPNVPEVLRMAAENNAELDLRDVSYFVGRESIFATTRPGMAIWREEFFAFMSRNAERPIGFLKLPRDRVVEVGIQVEI
jgi:KUP system potassium uptake protein